jgi:hypothetical protein
MTEDATDLEPTDGQNNIANLHLEAHVADLQTVIEHFHVLYRTGQIRCQKVKQKIARTVCRLNSDKPRAIFASPKGRGCYDSLF